MNNINYIYSYVHNGAWVFDDESRELDKEPFVEVCILLCRDSSPQLGCTAQDGRTRRIRRHVLQG